MKPEWFICKNCLFSEPFIDDPDYIGCHHTSQLGHEEIMLHNEYFCEKWTCKNCWQGWNEWEWDQKSDKELRIDHSQCEEVVFK